MRLTVAPGQWPGDDLATTMRAVAWARESGAGGVWFSEVNGFDAVGLAALAAHMEPSLQMTVGPVVAGVRSPAQTAMAVATISAVSSAAPRIALGAGNRRIVTGWHGRAMFDAPLTMIDHIAALRLALAGAHTASASSSHFRLAIPPPRESTIAVAALGPGMLDAAGGHADEVVVNLVPPAAIGPIVDRVGAAAAKHGRRPPSLTVWMIVGDIQVSGARVAKFLRPYLSADGYARVLAMAGIRAACGPELALEVLTGLGPPEAAVERARQYCRAGVTEIVAVGSPSDPAAGRSIAALADLVRANTPINRDTLKGTI